MSVQQASVSQKSLYSALWAACALAVLWNPWLASVVVSPLRYAVTIVHELSHCAAAILVGGRVTSFTISLDGSGLARTAVSSNARAAIVSSAGYLGAAGFGALLLALTNRLPGPSHARPIAVCLGVAFVIPTILLAVADQHGSRIGQAVGLIGGLGLGYLGLRRPLSDVLVALNVLALSTGLNAVLDCWQLVLQPDILAGGGVQNDAVQFSQYATGGWLPARLVGLVWTVFAILLTGWAAYWSVGQALLGEVAWLGRWCGLSRRRGKKREGGSGVALTSQY